MGVQPSTYSQSIAGGIGYHASHEQFSPSSLLDLVKQARDGGFDVFSCSDHFHPWSRRQGQSGYAWSWLGAALASTDCAGGVVCCPFLRYHPAIVAQACATLLEMFPGRFWMAVGSGEALNEHIAGPWPDKPRRHAMLRESVEVMRALWRGEEVTHRGAVHVDRARLYTLPGQPPLLLAAALTPETARWAGEWADGLITVSGARETMRSVVDAFRETAGVGKPVYLQVKMAYARDAETARMQAFDQWCTNVCDSRTAADTLTTEAFERQAADVTPADVERAVRIAADPARHAAWLAEDFEMGFDGIYLHNVGTNQQEAIEVLCAQVLPQLSSYRPAASGR
ncbi:MAG: TIGR03885 family FMN-dependent LLM class oxidoreductase [Pigmentiphaga sp.]|uniref:TIGR03885 family FMN-dependent LLM class oxidoreductase n=1 Tax=Pigmentiphaga sp. TaxID=1977564 RepID=UPI0029BC46BD|nr:TIGR03885 family FMN-dependent LLM class oxidoreductase [Pigmentiphaga sp.]MDX3906650.1 TIGR03885 family FMN-dependent LLM class oxidoreductase [Pigmentiphaga sp.]